MGAGSAVNRPEQVSGSAFAESIIRLSVSARQLCSTVKLA